MRHSGNSLRLHTISVRTVGLLGFRVGTWRLTVWNTTVYSFVWWGCRRLGGFHMHGIIDTCAGGSRFESTTRLCSLSYCMTARLTRGLEGRITEAFDDKCPRRIIRYRWHDRVSNQWLPGLYRHVALLPEVDPAHRVVFERNDPEWRMPRRPLKVHGLGKSMHPIGMWWESGLHRALPWGTQGGRGDAPLTYSHWLINIKCQHFFIDGKI